MDKYEKFKLLKLNIKQIFSEVKNRRKEKQQYKIDKLLQKLPVDNMEYEDLAPKSTIENGEEYINVLRWALHNKNVKNIALAGPYGSGKSSIIRSYLAKYPSTQALNISLATFDLEKEKDDNLEKEIELGVLKQLFYKVDSNRIPQSRYRKIKRKYYRKYFIGILLLSIITMLGFAFFAPDLVNRALCIVVESGKQYGLGKVTSYAVTSVFGIIAVSMIAYIIKWSTSNFRVKEVNIADRARVANEKDESSIFDKAMDEIIYFFEATNYNVIFIEDLDRFESTKIFVKLRELNNILNNYDLIKRRIVFVYAIKDDMFVDEERTKFFDFIVPVIPIINSTNSGEILRKRLYVEKQADEKVKSSRYDISSSYITLVSPFIEDMRLLTSICNEFIVYKKTLVSVNHKDEEMFSIMIYKNLYPGDFAELESEKGIVKQAFEDKKNFITTRQLELKQKKEELGTVLSGIEQDILNSVEEVKAAFLNYLAGTNGPLNYCYINGSSHYYHEIMQDGFDMGVFQGNNTILIECYRGRAPQIDFKTDKNIQRYLTRIEYLKNAEEIRKEEMRKEIEDCEKSSAELHTYTLMELIEIYGSERVLSEKVRENKFLVFLLRKGFINENYADYINYFHPNSITKDEMNYIRGIRMQEAVGDFSYTIRNVAEVCERIEDYEFRQKEALNFDVVDYLLVKKKENSKCREIFIGLSSGNKEQDEFIKAYIDRKQNIDIFINILCRYYTDYGYKLINSDLSTGESKYDYLSLILEYAELDDIIHMDSFDDANCISNFIVDNRESLLKLAKVSTDKMIQVIEELDIQFEGVTITGADVNVLNYIFENDKYIFNMDMFKSIFELLYPSSVERLGTSNYTTVLECKYEPLLNRIYSDFEYYVTKFVLEQETNVYESISAVEDIIERLFEVNIDLCKGVLDKLNVSWENIVDCCISSPEKKNDRKNVWNYVLKTGKVKATWHNYLEYHRAYGLTSDLVDWFNNNVDLILQEEKIDEFTDELLKELIVENISLEAFTAIVKKYQVDCFDCSMSSFDKERQRVLVENKWVPFTVKYLEEVKKGNAQLAIEYIVQNKETFMKNIDDVSLDVELITELIKNSNFTNGDKLQLMDLLEPGDMNQDIAMEIRNMEIKVKKTYVEGAWNILKESERYQLLLNQLEIYTIDELSEKFHSLAPVYKSLSNIAKRHKEYLDVTDYNRDLLQKLKKKDYITSFEEETYEKEDINTHQRYQLKRFGVWVKQKK